MKRLSICLLLFLFGGASVSQISVDSVRQSAYDYACVDVDADAIISQHQRQDKADAACLTAKLNNRNGTYDVVGGRWRIEVTGEVAAQSYPGEMNSTTPPPNNAPVWIGTPAPSFTEGTASSYDLLQDVSDVDGDTLTFAEETGCTYPTGVSLDNPNKELDYDGAGTPATASSCVLSIDDGTADPVDSAGFTVAIVASGVADFTICNSGCDYTTIGDAALAANPGEIFEIRADTGGGTKTYTETINWPSGTSGNYIEFWGRSGDTIIITENSTATGRTTLNLDGDSYLKVQNVQLGDGLNWQPAHTTDPRGQNQYRNVDCVNSHHIWLKDVIVKGADQYIANLIDTTCHHMFFENLTVSEHGSNAYQKSGNLNDTGDLWNDHGDNNYYKGGTWSLGGHNVFRISGSFVRVEEVTFDGGGWSAALIADGLAESEANKYPGTRAFGNQSGITKFGGHSPYGPTSWTRNVAKDVGPSQSSGAPSSNPVWKMQGSKIQFYDNIIYDGTKARSVARSRDGSNSLEADNNRIFHNTHYNLDSHGDGSDNNIAPVRTKNNNIWRNNIYAQMVNQDASRFLTKQDDVIQTTYNDFDVNNGWLDSKFDNNLFEILNGSMVVRVYPTTSSNTKTGISAIETEWSNWTNNDDSPTLIFVNAAARTRAGFVLDTGSDGLGTAVALTNMDGSGASTTSGTVDDPYFFFTPEAYDIDPADAHWGSEGPVADCIKIGSGSPVRLSTINYSTGAITIASARSWSGGDDVFMVKADDCTTVFDDIGIKE